MTMFGLKERLLECIKGNSASKEGAAAGQGDQIVFDSLAQLISNNLDKFPEFDYYIPIINKAVRNEHPHPDIAIECCNSLIQGISKSIILRLDPSADLAELESRQQSQTDQLFRRSLELIRLNSDIYEDDFVRRGVSLALAISTLRNARGDISHGRAVPKELQSDKDLARMVMEMTATVLRYTLASYYAIEFEKPVETIPENEVEKLESVDDEIDSDLPAINYDENGEFNDYLDEQYPLDGKVVYSKALYELYYEDYVLQLDSYQYEREVY